MKPTVILVVVLLLAGGVLALVLRDGSPEGPTPTGPPIAIRWERPVGTRWVGRFELSVRSSAQANVAVDHMPPHLDTTLRARIEVEALGSRDRADAMRVHFRYTRADDPAFDPRMLTHGVEGRARLAASGRPTPDSLELRGELAGAASRWLESLQMAGFGGGPLWVPDRTVREGGRWPVADLVKPGAFKALLEAGTSRGARFPDPVLGGHVTLERVEHEGDQTWLHLRLDGRIEMAGPLRAQQHRGRIELLEHVTGTAVVSASSGIPRELDVTRKRTSTSRWDGGVSTDERATTRIRGTIRREDP